MTSVIDVVSVFNCISLFILLYYAQGEIPTERRPFDRNIDMDHKKVDKKAASVFIKSAKGMDGKFENSKFEGKFL